MNETDATAPVAIEVRNLRSGQTIEMTVVGDWTEAAVADRLERIITVRQPSEIRLRLPNEAGSSDLPTFEPAQALLADVGGTLVIEDAASTTPDRSQATTTRP